MNYVLKNLTAAATFAVMATGASAVTITYDQFPTAAQVMPTATATTGAVFENVTGSISNVRRSPWQGSAIDENAADSFYTSVSGNSSATYDIGAPLTSISFLWGSPDSFNDLVFNLVDGGTVVVNGSEILGTPGFLGEAVTISDIGRFSSVSFTATINAFEYANLELTAVPVPAALPLMLAGMLGLGAVGRRKRKVA